MRLILTFLLFTLKLSAQTRIDAETGIGKGILKEVVDSGILALGENKSYIDYDISVPVSGVYTFSLMVANKDGNKSSIYLKLPTSTKVLASLDIPKGGWQSIDVDVKLAKTNKKIRLAFTGSSEVNYLTYARQGSDKVSKKDFDGLLDSLNKLKQKVDTSFIIFDARVFDTIKDSATNHSMISSPQLRPK